MRNEGKGLPNHVNSCKFKQICLPICQDGIRGCQAASGLFFQRSMFHDRCVGWTVASGSVISCKSKQLACLRMYLSTSEQQNHLQGGKCKSNRRNLAAAKLGTCQLLCRIHAHSRSIPDPPSTTERPPARTTFPAQGA